MSPAGGGERHFSRGNNKDNSSKVKKSMVCSCSKNRWLQVELCEQMESMVRRGWGDGQGTTM